MRPRLLYRLAQMPPGVVFVAAPPGTGKSTLLAHVADQAERGGTHVRRARATASGVVWQRSGGQEQLVSLAAAVDTVIALPTPAVVVVDDGDHLRSVVGFDQQLTRLVREAGPAVRVVIAVGALPPHVLARFDLAPAGILTGADLAFRSHEVEMLFRRVYGSPLRAVDAHLITRACEGWAAALELFHASTANLLPSDRRRAVRSILAEPWFLADYADNVLLAPLGGATQALLRWGSAFEVLTAGRLDALLGGADHDAQLRAVVRQLGAPVSSTAAGVRLPGPLRRYLRATHARDLGRQQARIWFRRSAEILEADGDATGAIGAWGRAGEPQQQERVLREIDDDSLHSSTLWRQARDAEPWDLTLLPGVAPRAAATALLSRAVADGAIDAAAGLLRELDGDGGAGAADDGATGAVRTLSWWGMGEGGEPGAPTDWRSALRTALRGGAIPAHPRAPGELFVTGLAHGLSRDVVRARQDLRLAAEHPAATRGLALSATLADLLTDPFEPLDSLAAGADQVLLGAHALGLTWLERIAQVTVIAAAGESGWREAVERVRSWSREVGDEWGALLAASIAEVCASRRDDDDAERWLALAQEWEALGAPVVAATCRVAGARATAWRRSEAASVPSALRLRCLGSLEITLGGRPLDLTPLRPRARSLLRLLAVDAGHAVRRERIVEALWPDLGASAATHNLHVSISAIRHVLNEALPGLGRRLLQRDGESYLVRIVPGVTCDLLDLDAALRAGAHAHAALDEAKERRAWRQVLALYTDDLLPEEGPAEWVLGPRDRLRTTVAGAATSLAVLELRTGDAAAAAAAARRAIELDECRDLAWRLLIEALTTSGEAATAQRARDGYRRMLRGLGIGVGTDGAGPVGAPGGTPRGLPGGVQPRVSGRVSERSR